MAEVYDDDDVRMTYKILEDFLNGPDIEECNAAALSRLCFNCLLPGHRVSDFSFKQNCKQCGKRHDSLLHVTNNEPDFQSDASLADRSCTCSFCDKSQCKKLYEVVSATV